MTMKMECRTAGSNGAPASLGDASRSGKASFAKAGRWGLRLVVAFVALLFLAPFAIIGDAEAACNNSYRVSHGDSDCLHAWWDNSPSSSCWGTKGGAQSFCSKYGDIQVKVDIVLRADFNVRLRSSSKWRYQNCEVDTRQISCCLDQSDLCHKNQVEAENGWIAHYVSSNNTFSSRNVSSHKLRYQYCEEHPGSVYCENDPEGDAFTEPLLCSGNKCVIGDCWSGWNQSDAKDSCEGASMAFDDSAIFTPLCTVTADCRDDDNAWVEAAGTTKPWSMKHLQNCSGEIKQWC